MSYKMTEAHKQSISKALKGKKKAPFTEEHKKKLAASKWKGGRYRDRKGYILIGNGRIREHRMVMERHLGRKLEKWEQVHHINGNKLDNQLKNLIVMTVNKHSQRHYPKGSKFGINSGK